MRRIFYHNTMAHSFEVLVFQVYFIYINILLLIYRLADAWENDFGVHPLKFPSETCLELLLILGLSTTSLPPSLQCMNSFQVRSSCYFSIMVLFLGNRDIPGAHKPF